MTKLSLSQAGFESLLTFCSSPPAEVAGAFLMDHYPELRTELIGNEWLEPCGNYNFVERWDDEFDEELEHPVCWVEEHGSFCYMCRYSGWIKVDNDELKVYRVKMDKFLATLQRALEIPERYGPICLVDDLLWDLGDTRIGRRMRPVLFSSRLHDPGSLEQILPALSNRVGRGQGILLVSGPEPSTYLPIPGQHKVIKIEDVIDPHLEQLTVDFALLSGRIDGVEGLETRSDQPIRCLNEGAVLDIHGRAFRFRGSKQRQVVDYLYQEWLNGNAQSDLHMMLETLDFSTSTRLRDLFKGHPQWREAIGSGHGMVWLIH